MTGPYARHPQVLDELLARASTLDLAADRIVAIYLSDPSRTPPEELRWDLGVVLDGNFEGAPGAGFELRELPAQEVVAVTTTLPEMGAASLTIDA